MSQPVVTNSLPCAARPTTVNQAIPSTPHPPSTSSQKLPQLCEKPSGPSLMAMAGKNPFSAAMIKVAYVLYRSAAWCGMTGVAARLLDCDILSASEDLQAEIDYVLQYAVKNKNSELLDSLLRKEDAEGKIAASFDCAIRNEIARDKKDAVSILMKAVARTRPAIFMRYPEKPPLLAKVPDDMKRPILEEIKPSTMPKTHSDSNAIDVWDVFIHSGLGNMFFIIPRKSYLDITPERKQHAITQAVECCNWYMTETLIHHNSLHENGKQSRSTKAKNALAAAINSGQSDIAEKLLKYSLVQDRDFIKSLIPKAAKNGMAEIVEQLARIIVNLGISQQYAYDIFKEILPAGGEKEIQALFDGGLQLNDEQWKQLANSFSNI